MADGRRDGAPEGGAPHKAGLPDMPRVDAIWRSPLYREAYRRVSELERDRPFCLHQAGHLLDVARIMWALDLERGLGIGREVVYATALLHDIGKAAQYEGTGEHEEVGAELASRILAGLPDGASFTDEEAGRIVSAIRGHRRPRDGAEPLEALLYQADKASRPCFACAARDGCSWPVWKMNLSIRV